MWLRFTHFLSQFLYSPPIFLLFGCMALRRSKNADVELTCPWSKVITTTEKLGHKEWVFNYDGHLSNIYTNVYKAHIKIYNHWYDIFGETIKKVFLPKKSFLDKKNSFPQNHALWTKFSPQPQNEDDDCNLCRRQQPEKLLSQC